MHRRGDIGGRIAQALAASVAAHHHTLDPVRAPEGLGGGHHIAGIHAGPHVGGREGDRLALMLLGDQRHPVDRKSQPLTGFAEGVNVARRLLAEGEVLPHHHLHHMKALDEQFVDIAVRGEFHEVGRERHHQEDIHAEFLDQFGPPRQSGQLRRMTAREDDLHRVRVEGHQYCRHTAGPARLDRPGDDLGVAAVHTVENPDGQHATAPVRGDLVLPAPTLHGNKTTAQRGRRIQRSGDDSLKRRRTDHHDGPGPGAVVRQQCHHPAIRISRGVDTLDSRCRQRAAVAGILSFGCGDIATRKRQQAGLIE